MEALETLHTIFFPSCLFFKATIRQLPQKMGTITSTHARRNIGLMYNVSVAGVFIWIVQTCLVGFRL